MRSWAFLRGHLRLHWQRLCRQWWGRQTPRAILIHFSLTQPSLKLPLGAGPWEGKTAATSVQRNVPHFHQHFHFHMCLSPQYVIQCSILLRVAPKYTEVVRELRALTDCDNQIINVEMFVEKGRVLVMEIDPPVRERNSDLRADHWLLAVSGAAGFEAQGVSHPHHVRRQRCVSLQPRS
jgi:hypothetical protein